MVLDIVTFPAESLRKKAEDIKELTPEIEKLIADMTDTLYQSEGFGLAAPQVGKSIRLLLADEYAGKMGRKPRVIINPEFILQEGEIIAEEGCLSIPGEYATVKRYSHVIVKALNEKMEPVEIDATDQLARILQHENDHLNGVLFIDRLPSFKRDTVKKHIKRRITSGDYVIVNA